MSLDEYYSATVWNGWVLRGGSLHSAMGHFDFWVPVFRQGSVGTHCGVVEYLITALPEI